jgi:hypothetical protein
MTKDDVVALGIEAQRTRDVFKAHCEMNTQRDQAEYAKQVKGYERARADMHEAMNRHDAALRLLGRDDIEITAGRARS